MMKNSRGTIFSKYFHPHMLVKLDKQTHHPENKLIMEHVNRALEPILPLDSAFHYDKC